MLVGYLGPKGSFTHDVATHSFPTSERIAYQTITDVIKAYENQEIDFAVVPVENSIEGSVHETLDYLFHQGTIQAVAANLEASFKEVRIASCLSVPLFS